MGEVKNFNVKTHLDKFNIQKLVQLIDTPIFAFSGKVSVNSKISVNSRISEMSYLKKRYYLDLGKKRLFLV